MKSVAVCFLVLALGTYDRIRTCDPRVAVLLPLSYINVGELSSFGTSESVRTTYSVSWVWNYPLP